MNPMNDAHEYVKGNWANECAVCGVSWFHQIHRGPWEGEWIPLDDLENTQPLYTLDDFWEELENG